MLTDTNFQRNLAPSSLCPCFAKHRFNNTMIARYFSIADFPPSAPIAGQLIFLQNEGDGRQSTGTTEEIRCGLSENRRDWHIVNY